MHEVPNSNSNTIVINSILFFIVSVNLHNAQTLDVCWKANLSGSKDCVFCVIKKIINFIWLFSTQKNKNKNCCIKKKGLDDELRCPCLARKKGGPKERAPITGIWDPTASNALNSCTRLTLNRAFIECKISMTNQMVPRGKKNSSNHDVTSRTLIPELII